MARTFREVWRWLVPRWLGVPDDPTDEGARVQHTIALMMDATLERARQGLDARFPSRTGESANALTAADRGLLRGRAETLAAFATRLKAWRTPRTHRVRGNAYELLQQVRAYWDQADSSTIDLRGVKHTVTSEGALSKSSVAWDWDSVDVHVTPAAGTASNVLGGGALTPSVPPHAPGALLLAHAFAEVGTLTTPAGWTLVASHSPSGANFHAVWARVAGMYEGGTLTISGAYGGRAIARVVQVPGTWDATIAKDLEVTTTHTGNGTSVTEPTFADALWASNVIAFVGYDSGGTVNAFTGGDSTWTEVAAEAVAGSAGGGVGIQTQYANADAGDTYGAATCTLGNTASWGVIAVRARRPWARFWLVFEPYVALGIDETPDLGDAALWGGALGTPGYTLGQINVTPADVLAMRNLFQQYAWHPEHTRPEWLVLVFPGGNVTPDGTWLYWSHPVDDGGGGLIQVPARSLAHRYWSLSPLANNTYAGNPERFANASELADATSYDGDAEDTAAWGAVVLPDGSAYVGDPENFPTSVLLLDDGTTP